MTKSDTGKTKEQLADELQDLRGKIIQLASLSEIDTVFKILPGMYFRLEPEEFIGKIVEDSPVNRELIQERIIAENEQI